VIPLPFNRAGARGVENPTPNGAERPVPAEAESVKCDLLAIRNDKRKIKTCGMGGDAMLNARQKQIENSDTNHFVSPRKQRPDKDAHVQPPLTPMIDVTFQLLLYFLLTIQFRDREGQIPGSLPEMGDRGPIPENIEIQVAPEGGGNRLARYSINQRAFLDVPAMQAHLKDRKSAYPKQPPPVIIRCRGDVRWKFVVEAYNATIRADFKKVGFEYL